MISFIRKCLAAVSACGVAAGVALYVASYIGKTMDGVFRWAIILHLGVFTFMLLMYVVEYPAFNSRVFFWKEFGRGMPKWVVPTIKGLGVFFALHFVLFLVQSHAAAPEIRNGEYFLSDHGRIVKLLTQPEYLSLKAAELRIFATGWIFFYFVPTAYWWFPRHRNQSSCVIPEERIPLR